MAEPNGFDPTGRFKLYKRKKDPAKRVPTSPEEAALEWFMQGATSGYLPHLQALGEPLIDRLSGLFDLKAQAGADVRQEDPAPWGQMNPLSPEYLEARDEGLAKLRQLEEEHPRSARVGHVAGIAASLPASGKLIGSAARVARPIATRGTEIVKRALPLTKATQAAPIATEAVPRAASREANRRAARQGLGLGATEGFLINPGDVEGRLDLLQLGERSIQSGLGAVGGTIGGYASRKIPGSIARTRRFLQDESDKWALKSAGAMLKEFRLVAKRGNIRELGDFMRDRILRFGDDVAKVARRSGIIKKRQGRAIGRLYTKAQKEMDNPDILSILSADQRSNLMLSGFKPVGQKKEIMEAIGKKLGADPNAASTMSFIDNYLDNVSEAFGQNVDITDAHVIKQVLQEQINWGKVAQDLPAKEKAYKALRKFVSDKIDDHFALLDKYLGGKRVKELKDANKIFSLATTIEEMSLDKVARESGNRFLSLGDRLAGTAGAGAGAVTSGIGGAVAGAGVSLLSKAARKYGSPIATKTLSGVETMLGVGETAQRLAAKSIPKRLRVPPKDVPGLASRAAIRHQATDFEEAPRKARGGPTRWASVSLDRLVGKIESPELREEIIGSKDELLRNKRIMNLLLLNPKVKPGSKAMKRILNEIEKERAGEKK